MADPITIPDVNATLTVDNVVTDIVHLKLFQEMGEHHDFEIKVDHTKLGIDFFIKPEDRLRLIHKKVVITLKNATDNGHVYVFNGMITEVRSIAEKGDNGKILLIGKSTTWELERGPMMSTFSNTDLEKILKEVTQGVGYISQANLKPAWKSTIDFAIQYRESDWQTIRRLCHQYQERFYFTGTDLFVGPHDEFEYIANLEYEKEIISLEACSRLIPNQFTTYFYERTTNDTLIQDDPGTIENSTFYLDQVTPQSDNLTRVRKPNTPTPALMESMDDLIEHNKRRKVTTGAEMMYIAGRVKTADVFIGRRIKIKMKNKDLGMYRVTKAIHQFAELDKYECYFEAIPVELNYIPTYEVAIPSPQPIETIVMENVDPQGLGRIKVRFPFDTKDCETWMPIMTPEGGNGSQDTTSEAIKNRGYVWIFEKGDHALVSFLDGQDLSNPFVIGSMFHRKNAEKLGGGEGNHIKTITDKSGGQIHFNTDEQGNWGITIHDINGNIMHFDTKGKNITITTPETLTLNSKNMNVNVLEDMTINVQRNWLEQVSGNKNRNVEKDENVLINKNYNIQALNNTIKSEKVSHYIAGDEMEQVAKEVTVHSNRGKILIDGTGKVVIQSKDRIDYGE